MLAEQLSWRTDSHYAAALSGGPQFIGWGHDRILAADIRDGIVAILLGLGGTKMTAADQYPRPKRPEVKQALTIAEFDTAAFMRLLASP